jgi:Ca-activated chloride channel family protein
MPRVVVRTLAAWLLLTPLAAQDTAQFRGRTDLVSVFATVADGDGRLVEDLKEADFQIFDNGKRQKITLFSAEVQPVTAVVMLDRSGSVAPEADWVREAAGEFVKRLLPADRARIGNFATEIRISPPAFTSDHEALMQVLRDDLQSVGPSPIWTSVDRSITALLPEHGRRVVLLMSDGVDAPMRSQVKTDVRDVMYRAQYDEIMVYAIGVPTEQVSAQNSIHADRSGRLTPHTVYTSKRGKPDPNLKLLASESGGGYFELDPMVSASALFARVADELHRQYWIGFAAGQLDHKVHKLEVKVLRGGLTVRARRSYVADPGR